MNQNYLEKEFTIASYNSDLKSRATIQSLLQFFQEIAWEHAEKLGVGYSDLINRKLIWVLVRQKIKINSFPVWQQKIKIKTCARGKERLFWYRDFQVTDENDSVLARATSSWLIIDLNTRRPYLGDDLMNIKLGDNKGFLNEELLKLPSPADPIKFYEKKVCYSDLDINNHVNNVKYLEWILDGYDFGFIKNSTIEYVELNYLSETTIGDDIQIYSDIEGNDHLHSIRSEGRKKELIKARIVWKTL